MEKYEPWKRNIDGDPDYPWHSQKTESGEIVYSMPVVKRIDAEITLKLGVMTFRPSHENNTIFPKTKKSPQSSKK